MLNQFVLVGRVITTPTLEQPTNNTNKSTITIAIPRSFKNAQGDYDTDFIDCVLWSGIATNTVEYCKKGDLIGIKGRIEGEQGQLRIIVEKVTFLSSNKKSEVD